MKRQFFCECGSGKYYDYCCSPQTEVWYTPINNQDEFEEMKEKVTISRQFNMRFRGLRQFYGDDLIAYKQKNPSSKSRNEFLTILAEYFTKYLEDKCPSTWQECDAEFWEEFLYSFYPSLIKVTPKQNEVEKFLAELKKFVYWLDRRSNTSLYSFIENIIDECETELKECEKMTNRLFLYTFPNFHNENLITDIEYHLDQFDFDEEEVAIFEVQYINGPIVVATAHDSDQNYNIMDMPIEIITPGMLVSGFIGREKGNWLWTWEQPFGVFPKGAKKFLKHILI